MFLQKQKLLQKSVKFMTISFSETPCVIHVISSTSYSRQSPQLQKNYIRPHKHNRLLPERTTRLCDANFIYRNLYCDIFNDCAVTTIFTISLLRLRSVNLFI